MEQYDIEQLRTEVRNVSADNIALEKKNASIEWENQNLIWDNDCCKGDLKAARIGLAASVTVNLVFIFTAFVFLWRVWG